MAQYQTTLPPKQEFRTACGGIITDPSKYPREEYRGETTYFCTEACLNVFLLNPDAFMAGEVEHPHDEE